MGEELQKLEELFRSGFILQEEYDDRKQTIDKAPQDSKKKAESTEQDPADDAAAANEVLLLPEMCALMQSNNIEDILQGVTRVRKLLCLANNPPIDDLIQLGGVPLLVNLLDSSYSNIQHQAAWALTNMASGTTQNTNAIIESGVIPKFINMIHGANDDLKDQAIWALGNIAGDSYKTKNMVLEHNVMPVLIEVLNTTKTLSVLRTGAWTLSNLCRSKPYASLAVLLPVLPLLGKMIHSADEAVITDSCWSLAYISDIYNSIQAVIECGVVRRHPSITVVIPALRTLGNIAIGNDMQTQMLLNCNILPCLFALLSSPKSEVIKEVVWTISNITAGNMSQIQAVIDSGFVPPIISFLSNTAFTIQKEAAWTMSNALSGANIQQVKYLVEQGCIQPLCNLLEHTETKVVSAAQLALESLCKTGAEVARTEGIKNPGPVLIEAAGGLEKLMQLKEHMSTEIKGKAIMILQEHFSCDSEMA